MLTSGDVWAIDRERGRVSSTIDIDVELIGIAIETRVRISGIETIGNS